MLAAFASSEEGKTFARIEQQYGRDPAAFLDDEVLAHNLRAAFLVTLSKDVPEDDPVEHTRQAGEQIRRVMDGRP
jgi:N-acyl-D-aspartate/D-glutamate deacylase